MKPPIKEFSVSNYPDGNITQRFDENPDLYSRWGLKGHNGIDIVAPWGTPMYAIEDGVVLHVKNDPAGYGKVVRIMTDREVDAGTHYELIYGHCSEIHVQTGDCVSAGQHIADMGNTGFVISGATPFWKHNPYAGTHLHFGLRKIKKDKKGWSYPGSDIRIQVLDYDNGYKGAIDPFIYLVSTMDGDFYRRQQLLTLRSLLQQLLNLLKKQIG